jgi:hypothetical protein
MSITFDSTSRLIPIDRAQLNDFRLLDANSRKIAEKVTSLKSKINKDFDSVLSAITTANTIDSWVKLLQTKSQMVHSEAPELMVFRNCLRACKKEVYEAQENFIKLIDKVSASLQPPQQNCDLISPDNTPMRHYNLSSPANFPKLQKVRQQMAKLNDFGPIIVKTKKKYNQAKLETKNL